MVNVGLDPPISACGQGKGDQKANSQLRRLGWTLRRGQSASPCSGSLLRNKAGRRKAWSAMAFFEDPCLPATSLAKLERRLRLAE